MRKRMRLWMRLEMKLRRKRRIMRIRNRKMKYWRRNYQRLDFNLIIWNRKMSLQES